jgi:hypothetical protein
MKLNIVLLFLLTVLLSSCSQSEKQNKPNVNLAKDYVRGWNILSDNVELGLKAIDSCRFYDINHLQLSHYNIMNLNHVRDAHRLETTRTFIRAAQEQGVENIYVWDRALYELEYYPDEFKMELGLINLDNPEFWNWIKADYRSMLDSLPDIRGIILTFVETGAHVEDQHSERMQTEGQKLAGLVDSLATVIIDERGLELIIRTFVHRPQELESMIECANLIIHPKVKIMSKEVPHDFFIPHPVSEFIKRYDRDAIIEFDLGHEYNGQGVVASIMPELTIKRWKYFARQPNVIGYVARTDRELTSQNVGRATEVNMYALKRITEDTTLTAETIVEEFIEMRYGKKAVPYLKEVFMETDEIIESMFYTLGLQINWHSGLNTENQNSYSTHVSGVWMDNPVIYVGHDVNKTFHFWKDAVEHLAPPRFKGKEFMDHRGNLSKTILGEHLHYVIDSGWVTPEEKMNKEYLDYVVAEKRFCENKAAWALEKVRKAAEVIEPGEVYHELLHLYERTYMTAQLWEACFSAYFGFRYYTTNQNDEEVNELIRSSLKKIEDTSEEMLAYEHDNIKGQMDWIRDVRDGYKNIIRPITQGYRYADNLSFPYKPRKDLEEIREIIDSR